MMKEQQETGFPKPLTLEKQVIDALQSADTFVGVDYAAVKRLNEEGIHLGVQRGRFPEAFACFLEALRKSGFDLQLRADCLMNMGDLLRRGPGDIDLARKLFAMAKAMPLSFTRKSRLRTMEAMIFSHATERGEDDPEGIAKNLALLEEAMELAGQAIARGENTIEGEASRSFAAHRYVASAAVFGTPEQSQKALKLIEEMLSLLEPASPNKARFHYAKALIIRERKPREALKLLVQSALQMEEDFPLDAGPYWVWAGLIAAQQLQNRRAAQLYLLRAVRHEEEMRRYSNSAHVLKRLEELRAELGN